MYLDDGFGQNKVAQNNKRKYIKDIAKLWLGRSTMSKQAKTLTEQDVERVLAYIAKNKHPVRNRAMFLTMLNTGVRISELVSISYFDAVDDEGNIRDEIMLKAENTKTKEARTIFVNTRLHKELTDYIAVYKPKSKTSKLFYSQKGDGFTANTGAQLFHYLYRRVGLVTASSHSARRTFITNLSERCVGIRVIMSLSGHRQLSSVQAYLDCNADQQRKAVNLL